MLFDLTNRLKLLVLKNRFLRRIAYSIYGSRPIPGFPYGRHSPFFQSDYGLFVFSGSSENIGRQFGTAFPQGPSFERARRYLSHIDVARRAQLRKEIASATDVLKENFPEMLAMMRGAQTVTPWYLLEEIVLSVFFTVLTDFEKYWTCSSIATMDCGLPVVGQNLDLGRTNNVAIACLIPDHGQSRIVHINPKTMWMTALINEGGLSAVGSSVNVGCEARIDGRQIPQEILTDLILSRACTVDEALSILHSLPTLGPLSGGLSMLLADSSGAIRQVDMTGKSLDIVQPENSIWITTNHFRGELSRLNDISDDLCIELGHNSRSRFKFAIEAFSGTDSCASRIRALMRARDCSGAWFRAGVWPDVGYTTASYLMDYRSKRFEYWLGSDAKESRSFNYEEVFRDAKNLSSPRGISPLPESNKNVDKGEIRGAVHIWISFLADAWTKFGFKIAVLIAIMVISGFTEGASMILFVPLLTELGIGTHSSSDAIMIWIERFAGTVGQQPGVEFIVGLMMIVLLMQCAFHYWQGKLVSGIEAGYVAHWRRELFSAVLHSDWHFLVKRKSGGLIYLLMGDIDRIGRAMFLSMQLLSTFAVLLIYILITLLVSWKLTVGVVIVTTIMLMLAVILFAKRGIASGQSFRDHSDSLHAMLEEFIGGIRLLKTTATEFAARDRLEPAMNALEDEYKASVFEPYFMRGVLEFLAMAMLCLFVALSIQYLAMEPALVLVIATIVVRMMPRLYGAQIGIQTLSNYLPSFEAVRTMYGNSRDVAESLADGRDSSAIVTDETSISVRNISVILGDAEILHDVSLEIKHGQMIAIAGASGAGKSTLIDCIARLINPFEGQILMNGQPIGDFNLHAWRRGIGYVSQDIVLFDDTIRNNIAWGHSGAGMDDIVTAAKMACAHDFIVSLEDGYNTAVGNRGVRLSGGQKQRIALARALVGKPNILVLDEATSALDIESENDVLSAVGNLRGEVTIIFVSHRPPVLRSADKIYVLGSGEIVASGTWDQLNSSRSGISALWEMSD